MNAETGALAGRVAIVTGASSGIGLAVAHAIAAAGAAVVLDYHAHPEPAREAAHAIGRAGGRARAVAADVGRADDVARLFDIAIEAFGGLDIVVSNAGAQDDAPIGDMTLAQWNHVIGTDLTGGFLVAREAIRRFRAQPPRGSGRVRGNILFTTSVHQVVPWAGHANYAAAKAGLAALMETLAQEVAAEGIRVNAIAPGAIRTPINQAVTDGASGEKLRGLIPWGRFGETGDVARAAAWLLGDDAEYVVGHTLFVDGGISLYPAFRDNG